MADTSKCGLAVYTPDKLEEVKETVTVIEALEKWKQLDDSIKERFEHIFYHGFYAARGDITCYIDGVERKVFSLEQYWAFHRFLGKKVYIYGNGGVEREFTRYLKINEL